MPTSTRTATDARHRYPAVSTSLLPGTEVAERGGVMGAGSRRVMGVGLPLLDLLTVPQFRAVLAHEFGHFVGGDTRLGPWIYKTRAAIGRTTDTMGVRGNRSQADSGPQPTATCIG